MSSVRVNWQVGVTTERTVRRALYRSTVRLETTIHMTARIGIDDHADADTTVLIMAARSVGIIS